MDISKIADLLPGTAEVAMMQPASSMLEGSFEGILWCHSSAFVGLHNMRWLTKFGEKASIKFMTFKHIPHDVRKKALTQNSQHVYSWLDMRNTKYHGNTSCMMIKESLANRSIKSNANFASFGTHHPPHKKEYKLNIPIPGTKERKVELGIHNWG